MTPFRAGQAAEDSQVCIQHANISDSSVNGKSVLCTLINAQATNTRSSDQYVEPWVDIIIEYQFSDCKHISGRKYCLE
jgi:hypothetical protein